MKNIMYIIINVFVIIMAYKIYPSSFVHAEGHYSNNHIQFSIETSDVYDPRRRGHQTPLNYFSIRAKKGYYLTGKAYIVISHDHINKKYYFTGQKYNRGFYKSSHVLKVRTNRYYSNFKYKIVYTLKSPSGEMRTYTKHLSAYHKRSGYNNDSIIFKVIK